MNAYSRRPMQPETAQARRSPAGAPTPPSILSSAWPALPAIATAVFVLLRLGFDQGGYFPAAYTSAGAVAFITLGILVLHPLRQRLSTHALVAVGALAAFAFWTGLSRLWSGVPDVPLLDMHRAMLYLALFGLGLLAADTGRNARVLVWSVLGVVIAICGAGLLSRLQPDLVTSSTDPSIAVFYRLDHPLGYWNAFGALASLGAVLALGLTADGRAHVILRCGAAGAALTLVVAMYLSLSRGAWLALIVGLIVLVAVAPRRWALLLTLAVVGAAATIAILRLEGYPALVIDPQAGEGQVAQSSAFTRELIGLVLVVIAAQAALCFARGPSLLDSHVATLRRVALGAGAIIVVLAVGFGYAAKGEEAEGGVTAAADDATAWLDRQWQDFLNPTANAGEGVGAARLITTKGARSDGYRVAIDGFEERPLTGGGAGSFEVRYARDRDLDVKFRDAHSLPLETLSELGAVGMLLLLGFIGAVATAARRSIAGRGAIRPAEAAAVTAAVMVWLGHASVDWDWEMPVLTGVPIVLSAAMFQRGRRRSSRGRSGSRNNGHAEARKAG